MQNKNTGENRNNKNKKYILWYAITALYYIYF